MINWDAAAAIAALLLVVGGVVRFTMKGVLAEFKETLRETFPSKERVDEIERRIESLERGVRA